MLRRYRRQITAPDNHNTERWLVSYADYMTIMFAFFVVMYALAMTKEQEFQVLSESLESMFAKSSRQQTAEGSGIAGDGILPKPVPEREETLEGTSVLNEDKGPELVDGFGDISNIQEKYMGNPLDSVEQDLKNALSDELETGQAKLNLNEDWLTIELSSGLIFPSASATVTTDTKNVAEKIYTVLNKTDNYVRVRGYTDNEPINNEIFKSNWQLSVARATQMLELLVELGIEPARLAIEGYGAHRPFASNDTEQGRAQNRKVVVALSKYGWQGNTQTQADAPAAALNLNDTPPAAPVNQEEAGKVKLIPLEGGGFRITTRDENPDKKEQEQEPPR